MKAHRSTIPLILMVLVGLVGLVLGPILLLLLVGHAFLLWRRLNIPEDRRILQQTYFGLLVWSSLLGIVLVATPFAPWSGFAAQGNGAGVFLFVLPALQAFIATAAFSWKKRSQLSRSARLFGMAPFPLLVVAVLGMQAYGNHLASTTEMYNLEVRLRFLDERPTTTFSVGCVHEFGASSTGLDDADSAIFVVPGRGEVEDIQVELNHYADRLAVFRLPKLVPADWSPWYPPDSKHADFPAVEMQHRLELREPP